MMLIVFLSNISVSLALVSSRASTQTQHFLTPTSRSTCTKAFLTPQSSSCTNRCSHLPSSSSSSFNLHSGKYAALFASSSTYSSSSSTQPSASKNAAKTIVATTILILLDIQFRSIFRKYSIPFPSSLAGCGALFATMISLSAVNEQIGERMYQLLNPGAILLAKWLPVFFVPSLITLPLASGLGTVWEVVKVFSVIIGGFLFTLFTSAWSVLGIRKLLVSRKSYDEPSEENKVSSKDVIAASAPPVATQAQSKNAFSKTLFRTLESFAWISGICTVVQVKNSPSSKFINIFQSSFLLFATLSSFVFGANLPTSFTKVVHPLVTCTSLTWIAAKLLSQLTESTFLHILRSYKCGTLSPLSAGAGDVLLFLLGPAVVALSCQMYGRKKLMRENISEVATSTVVASIGGLYGTAAAVRLLGIANPTIRLSLLSRNITSPLAMAIASILGADASLAVTIVVLTGLFGANFGASILDAAGIKDAVARGLGIGAAAHGLGTAAFANEKDAFPFAAIGMALTASACTVLVSLPFVRKSVLSLALGV